MRPSKKNYPPRADCAFLVPKPNGKGYSCAALTELMCATKGTCKFIKRRGDKYGT